MFSVFKNIKSPYPISEIDVYEFLDRIKNPEDSILFSIQEARKKKALKEDLFYDKAKSELPCFTLNFSFEGRKSNSNIKQPSGFIYLDIDDETDLDCSNPLIFASWLSLSKRGRGVLVKIEGLTKENFAENYEAISKELKLETDSYAAKATQYTVHSYDEKLFINEDSITWSAINETSPISLRSKGGKRKGVNDLGVSQKLYFDNIHEIEFDGEEYIVFPDKKELTAKAFIPKTISKGGRNAKLSAIAFQLRTLNPSISDTRFISLIKSINNNHCRPPLIEKEVDLIITNILKSENLEPYLNTPRRVIFNPESSLSKKEKMTIVNKVTGKIRSNKTLNGLRETISKWDFENLGKITQVKLADVSGRNIKTVEKYYKHLKDEIYSINQSILLNPKSSFSPA